MERSHVYDLTPSLAVYVCYVDDISTVVNSTDEARKLLTTLYSTHPIIKFELEFTNQDCFLPILDIRLNIDESGNITHRLFLRNRLTKGSFCTTNLTTLAV